MFEKAQQLKFNQSNKSSEQQPLHASLQGLCCDGPATVQSFILQNVSRHQHN
jgi:hypothetical protein